MKQIAAESKTFWANVMHDQQANIDPTKPPLEVLERQLSASEHPELAEMLKTFSKISQTEQLQAEEVNEMRGRLLERYKGCEFRLAR